MAHIRKYVNITTHLFSFFVHRLMTQIHQLLMNFLKFSLIHLIVLFIHNTTKIRNSAKHLLINFGNFTESFLSYKRVTSCPHSSCFCWRWLCLSFTSNVWWNYYGFVIVIEIIQFDWLNMAEQIRDTQNNINSFGLLIGLLKWVHHWRQLTFTDLVF